MRILLLPNIFKPQTIQVLREFCALLNHYGITVCALEEDRQIFESNYLPTVTYLADSEHLEGTCDLLCAIGGDGTLLRYAHLAAQSGIPITGINTGKVGFLAQIEPDKLEYYLRTFLDEQYIVEERIALQANWSGCKASYVLNDIVLSGVRRSPMIYFTVLCDDRLVEGYRADSLIISTPTGSTAYNLAAGGAVQEASMKSVSFQPICAQFGLKIPLIFSSSHQFAVTCSERVEVICDGQTAGTIPRGGSIRITQAERLTPTIAFEHIQVFPGFRRRLSALEASAFD